MYLLFSGLHLRDATAALFVNTLYLTWIWFIKAPWSPIRQAIVTLISVAATFTLYHTRAVWVFIPPGFTCLAFGALAFSKNSTKAKILRPISILLLGLATSMTLAIYYYDAAATINDGYKSYITISNAQTTNNSLGAQFIVNKKNILRKPRDFYLKIVNLLDYSIHPDEGFVIERLHKYILTGL